MTFLLYSFHIVVSIFLILVVLLQQGKGADLSVFGGGATMAAFGARGAATVLHKLTVYGFVAFIVTTLAIGVVQGNRGQSTVMGDVPAVEEVTPEAPASATTEADSLQLPVEGGATAAGGEADQNSAPMEDDTMETPIAEGAGEN